jgi:hypothetical protein
MTHDETTATHILIDETLSNWRDLIEQAVLDAAEAGYTVNEATIFAQVMMNAITAHWLDPENKDGFSVLTAENKKRLVDMASTAGPDYTQAFYHAAVFMTKVA